MNVTKAPALRQSRPHIPPPAAYFLKSAAIQTYKFHIFTPCQQQSIMKHTIITSALALVAVLMHLPVMSQDSCRVALVQSVPHWGDIDSNLHMYDSIIRQCHDTQLIVFPELFVTGCEMRRQDKAQSVAAKSATAAQFHRITGCMTRWAEISGAVVIGSTVYEHNGLFFNRLIAAWPDGHLDFYDKHNCFKKGSFSPGEKDLIIDINGIRFSTYICYDLRFPEWSRNNGRYHAAIYIANWPDSRRDDWQHLLKERALENDAYVIGVNCAGNDPLGPSYAGDSRVVSPQGEVVSQCRPYTGDICYFTIFDR